MPAEGAARRSHSIHGGGSPRRSHSIHDSSALHAAVATGSLRHMVVQDLDLTGVDLERADGSPVDVTGTLFLGCTLPSGAAEALMSRGALLFPRFTDRPYDSYRSALYSGAELSAPCGSDGTTRDQAIYRWYVDAGTYLPDIGEALAQRTHDLSIDDALGELIGHTIAERLQRRIVGIMGGHAVRRDAPEFERAARIAFDLAARGYLITTGGGPGVMEAGNLGAYLSGYAPSALDEALKILRKAPNETDSDYLDRAAEVRATFPKGAQNLSVPTWFYGFERSNQFATHIAKYFANSIREEGLLAICLAGIVFADGSAGTVQEVFQDAAQNFYATFDYRSPMVFLGRQRWEPTPGTGVAGTLRAEAGDRGNLIFVTDDADDAVRFIVENPPVPAS